MPICDESWIAVSIHEVFAAFLLAERDKFTSPLFAGWEQRFPGLIDTPNLDDPSENSLRMQLLYADRRRVMGEVPPDTSWHKVRSLREAHLDELRIIRCGEWVDQIGAPADDRRLETLLKHTSFQLTKAPMDWGPIILWGHSRIGPFTILEGNHRLLAYVGASPRTTLEQTVYIGTSPSHCMWHEGDPIDPLLWDMWKCS